MPVNNPNAEGHMLCNLLYLPMEHSSEKPYPAQVKLVGSKQEVAVSGGNTWRSLKVRTDMACRKIL